MFLLEGTKHGPAGGGSVMVTSVDENGSITGVELYDYGANYSMDGGLWQQTVGGHGTGADLWVCSTGSGMVNTGIGDVGACGGKSMTSGVGNTMLGNYAGQSLSTGFYNVMIGYYAGAYQTNANNVVAIGLNAALVNQAEDTVAVGNNAYSSGTVGVGNTALGAHSLQSLTQASYNTAVGRSAMASSPGGDNNTAIGSNCLCYVQGKQNTAIGAYAGMSLGYQSAGGDSNSFLGYNAGLSVSTGSYNVAIGMSAAGATGPVNYSSTIAIGAFATPTTSNQGVIGGANPNGVISDLYIGQGVSAASPGGITIHATGGSGMDNPGGPLTLAGGQGTGAGPGGSVHFQVAPHGATGLNPNSLSDVAIFDESGGLTLPYIRSNSGTRYLCVDSNGTVTASTTACSGS